MSKKAKKAKKRPTVTGDIQFIEHHLPPLDDGSYRLDVTGDEIPDAGPTVTAAEAAELLGKSRRTIGRMLTAGQLPGAVRTPQGWRIPRDALDAGTQPAEPAAPPTDDAGTPPPENDTHRNDTPVAELQAELADWRRRAEVAEAVAAERADALADARASLALAQRLAALNLVENAPYRDAQEITESPAPPPADDPPFRRIERPSWLPRWQKR